MKALRCLALVVSSLAATACSSADASEESRSDDLARRRDASAPDAASDAATDAAPAKDAGPAGKMCSRTIAFARHPIPPPLCVIKSHVGNDEATVSFPCEGGEAKATFGGKTFAGTVSGTKLELTYESSFVFQGDGCTWDYVETITGDIDGNTVAYTYRDSTKTPQCANEAPCPADTQGTIRR